MGVQAQVYAPATGSQTATKPWSVSATLRGFYDDNYSTSPKALERDSYGFEVSPSASLNLIRDQTAVGLSYVYSLRWYEDRDDRGMSATDQAHMVNAKLSHAFTPRYKLDITDSFVVAQEPDLIEEPGTPRTVFLRSEGDNLRNTVLGSFSIGVTETTTVVLGYSNQYFDYDEQGVLNSRSALLDRVEHLGSINLRQVVLPQTVLVGGYHYEVVDYNSNDLIGSAFFTSQRYSPDERDSNSHYFYVGVDQGITATLNASVRGGAQLMEYDFSSPLLAGLDEDRWSPYVDANVTWNYLQGSYAQLGVRHQRLQTDVGFIPDPILGLVPNLDAEATTVYGSVSHRVFGALVASLIGQYQHSSYDNDLSGDFADDYFMAGVNLTYEINKFLAAEVGYNYDRLDSELTALGQPRSFTRNRVYVGIRGTY